MLWEQLGYSPQQIERMRQMQVTESMLAGAGFFQAPPATPGVPETPPGPTHRHRRRHRRTRLPRDEHGIRLTDHYRRQLLAVRETVTGRALPVWQALDFGDFPASFGRLGPLFVAITAGGQGAMVASAGGYATAYLRNEVDDPAVTPALDASRGHIGRTVAGAPLADMLPPVMFTVEQAQRMGWDDGKASRAGWNKLSRAIAWQTLSAAQLALGDIIRATDEFTGWRRVASQTSCGACLGMADGDTLPDTVAMHRHSHCRCVAAPVVRGVRERARFQTGQELFDGLDEPAQAALFAGRGGEAKAAVAREQGVGVLVDRDRTDTAGTLIAEKPLEALDPQPKG